MIDASLIKTLRELNLRINIDKSESAAIIPHKMKILRFDFYEPMCTKIPITPFYYEGANVPKHVGSIYRPIWGRRKITQIVSSQILLDRKTWEPRNFLHVDFAISS